MNEVFLVWHSVEFEFDEVLHVCATAIDASNRLTSAVEAYNSKQVEVLGFRAAIQYVEGEPQKTTAKTETGHSWRIDRWQVIQ